MTMSEIAWIIAAGILTIAICLSTIALELGRIRKALEKK